MDYYGNYFGDVVAFSNFQRNNPLDTADPKFAQKSAEYDRLDSRAAFALQRMIDINDATDFYNEGAQQRGLPPLSPFEWDDNSKFGKKLLSALRTVRLIKTADRVINFGLLVFSLGAAAPEEGAVMEVTEAVESRVFNPADFSEEVARHKARSLLLSGGDGGEYPGLILNGMARRATISPILQQQRALSQLVNRQGAVIDRWLGLSKNRWARLYRAMAKTNPNFAKGIRGRFLDIRMRGLFRERFRGVGGILIDQTVPASGSNLRPDLYFDSLGGRSVIFDVGSPSKIDDILKYEGMADELIPLIPYQWF